MKTKNVLVIFGSTGDLTGRKLLPALGKLLSENEFSSTQILTLGRKEFTTKQYLDFACKKGLKNDFCPFFQDKLEYLQMNLENDDYQVLKDKIDTLGDGVNIFYYLAVAPSFFLPIVNRLFTNNLIKKGDNSRFIAFEKPFGTSLSSAMKLKKEIEKYVNNDQVFLVDHYLGKDMVTNLLTLRFTNPIIEAGWNSNYISKINIYAKESETILKRGAYYDMSGALKDMVQSHLLQVLALLTMEKPLTMSEDNIVKNKLKALESIVVNKEKSFLGQYDGYKNEQNVESQSTTNTFVFLKSKINNSLLKGVDLNIITGKKLGEKHSFIEIVYKNKAGFTPNSLIIEMDPESRVTINFNSQGSRHSQRDINSFTLEHCFSCDNHEEYGESYERIFLGLVSKNHKLFSSFEESLASWKLIYNLEKDLGLPIIYKDYDDILQRIGNLI